MQDTRQLNHTSACDRFMYSPELHLLITALSGSFQGLHGGRVTKHCRTSSSLLISREPEAYPAIVTWLVSPSTVRENRILAP